MNFLKRIEKLLGINDNKKKKKKETAKPKSTPLKRNVVKTSSKTTPLNRTTTTKSTPLKRNTTKSTPLNIQRNNKYVSSVGSKDRKSSDIVKNYKENKGNRTLNEATKDIKSTGKAVGYVGKKTGQGILGGATGFATAGTSEARNQYQKGEKSKKSNASMLLDIAKGTLELGRPEQQTQKVIKAIIKNVDKASKTKGNIRKKAINFLLDSTQDATDIGLNKDYVDKYLQFQGKNYKNLTGKSLSKKVEKLEDTINKPYEKNAEKLNKEAQNYNKGTQFAGDVLETVGRMGPSIATTALTKNPNVGLGVMGVSAKGSATREALNKGAPLDLAVKMGTGKGWLEVGTEKLTSGAHIFGGGALDDIAEKGIQKTLSKVGGQGVKHAILDKGLHGLYDVLGENLEEWITDVVDTQIDKATVDPKAKYTLADWGQTTALTTASTIVLNLLTRGMVGGVRVDMDKAINQTENQLNTKFTDKEKNLLKDNALKDLMYKNAYDKANNRIQENKKLINKKVQEAMTLNQNKTLNTTEAQRSKLNDAINIKTGEIQALKQQNKMLAERLESNENFNELGRYKSNDSRLAQIEQAIPSEMYETPINIETIEQNQYDTESRIANLLVSAKQNLNNSEASQSFVKMLSNLAKNKGYNIVFNPDMGENINGRIVTNENAKTIELNPNSDKSATFVLMHELSHDIGTQEISEDINNFRGENTTFDEWYKNREQLYREQTNLSEEEIQEEMMCDSIGELLGNEEYINHLTTKPTLMQKIMDWIDKFLGRTEKGSQEYNYLQQLKQDFEKAYNGETQENNTIKNSTELSTKDSEGRKLTKEQQDYFKDSKVRDENGNLLRVYRGRNNEYTVFDREKAGTKGTYYGAGFYFTNDSNEASFYGDVSDYYLDMKNPYLPSQDQVLDEFGLVDFVKSFYDDFEERFENQLPNNWKNANNREKGKIVRDILEKNGYDGVINGTNYVVFNSNQIKNIDNTNPTTNDDIRYSQNLNEEEVNKLAKELDELDPEVMAQAFLEKEGDRLKQVAKENNIELTDKQIKQLYNQHVTKANIGTMLRLTSEMFENRNYEIDRIAKITKNKNIKLWGDEINNMQGEIETNLNTAQTDEFGNIIGESINDIFAPYEKDGRGGKFNDYLFHKSNIERHKNGVGSQVPMEDSTQLVKAYEKDNPDFKDGAERVNNYNRNLLKRQVKSGIISQETANNITKKYEFYVPFYENEYLDSKYVQSDTDEVKSGNTLRKAQGGADQNLMLFKEAMARQTQQAISNSYKNEFYKEIVNTLPKKAIDIMENLNPDEANPLLKDGKKHYLTAFENGTPTQVEISQELFNELNKTFENQIKSVEKAMAIVTKPLQQASSIRRNILTSWSPSFVVTNPTKDVQDAFLNTKYPKDFAKHYGPAFKELATGKDTSGELQKFLNKYGKPNIMGDYSLEGVDSDVAKLFKDNGKINKSALTKLAKKLPQINDVLEMTPRYAEYLASLDNGCSQLEALYNAREVTVNFGRGGYIAKLLNRNGFTFLNAQIQGFSKFFRNFHDAPVRTTMRATAYGLSVALINELLHGDDDDYDLLPDYIKDNYYLFKVSSKEELKAMPKDMKEKYVIKKGKSTFIRIPKGRMLSVFSSFANRTKDRAMGRRGDLSVKDDVTSWIKNATNQIGLPDMGSSNLFAPIIQASKNEAWYGGQIVPKRLMEKDGKKIPAKQQYDASTDKLSIWLGQKTGISPYKINYVLDQYTGGIGDMLIPLITDEAQSSSNSIVGTALAPLKDKFTADTINDNKNVTNFYSKAEKLGEKSNDVNATGKDKLKSGYMDNVSYQMGALYKQIRDVQADKNLSKKEKYERYEVLKSQINELAKNGLENVNKVKGDEYYGEVEENGKTKQLFRSAKGNYYELYDNQKEALDKANLSVKERNNLYKTKDEISKYLKSSTDKNKYSKRYAIIKDSNNSQSAKAVLYNQNKQFYQKDPTPLVKDNLVDSFLDIESQNIKSDYDKNGKIVYNSKKKKIIKAINKLNLSAKDKQKLYDFYYPSKTKGSSSGVGSKGSKKRSSGSKKAPTKGSKRTTTTKTPKITRTKVTPVKLSNKSVKLTPVKAKSTSNNKYYQEALKNLLFKKTK